MSYYQILGGFRSHILYGPSDWHRKQILEAIAEEEIEIPAPEILMLTEILDALPTVNLNKEFPDMPDSWC